MVLKYQGRLNPYVIVERHGGVPASVIFDVVDEMMGRSRRKYIFHFRAGVVSGLSWPVRRPIQLQSASRNRLLRGTVTKVRFSPQ